MCSDCARMLWGCGLTVIRWLARPCLLNSESLWTMILREQKEEPWLYSFDTVQHWRDNAFGMTTTRSQDSWSVWYNDKILSTLFNFFVAAIVFGTFLICHCHDCHLILHYKDFGVYHSFHCFAFQLGQCRNMFSQTIKQ